MNVFIESEKEADKLQKQLQEERAALERLQGQQAEDSRGVSKQQKNTERYLAKRNMLMNRKDETNRSIRDLGVLPEEAFEKYTNEKSDRVNTSLSFFSFLLSWYLFTADEEASYGQRRPKEVRSCQ